MVKETQLPLFVSQHFKVLVEDLHVKGEAKIKNALKESFKILNEVCVSAFQGTGLVLNKRTSTWNTCGLR